VTARALQSGKPQFVSQASHVWEEKIAEDKRHADLMKKLQIRSVISVPLKIRHQTIGVMTFVTVGKGNVYTQADLQVAKEIAGRAAVAIDNATLYQESKEAIQARDEFLSIASHELKTPLTSMLLQLQTVLHSIKSESLANFSIEKTMTMLESTIGQSKRLSKLVNDLLNISLITTGRLELEKEEVDLTKVTKEVVSRLEETAEKSGITLEFEGKGKVTGKWDKIRLEQVVTNLITNGIKYGDSKPVTVSVSNSNNIAQLQVSDRGIGIPEDQKKIIFNRFERGDVKGSYKGLGVGLYLVNEIVKAHGGKVEVESKPHKGSVFTVKLPLRK
jgi:signal transduction histidine kinase